ncbi:hypothetical protein KA517_01900 [Candidatus Gracilibacteria bacterium]|nr:hypothetical protein [Candidatus Gracilibacteria bacterium]
MLQPQLTVDYGLARIGTVRSIHEAVITKKSLLTLVLKEFRESLRVLFEAGWVDTDPSTLVVSARASSNIMRAITINTDIRASEHAINAALHALALDLGIANFTTLQRSFRAAVLNAVEHGTEFCRSEPVIIKSAVGSTGVLVVLSQSSSMLPRSRLASLSQVANSNAAQFSVTYPSGNKEVRGRGLTTLVSPDTPAAWFLSPDQTTAHYQLLLLAERTRRLAKSA